MLIPFIRFFSKSDTLRDGQRTGAVLMKFCLLAERVVEVEAGFVLHVGFEGLFAFADFFAIVVDEDLFQVFFGVCGGGVASEGDR